MLQKLWPSYKKGNKAECVRGDRPHVRLTTLRHATSKAMKSPLQRSIIGHHERSYKSVKRVYFLVEERYDQNVLESSWISNRNYLVLH